MLELLNGVLASCALSRELDDLLLDSLVLETLGDKLTNEQLLLFRQIVKLLVVLLLIFVELLNELFSD